MLYKSDYHVYFVEKIYDPLSLFQDTYGFWKYKVIADRWY